MGRNMEDDLKAGFDDFTKKKPEKKKKKVNKEKELRTYKLTKEQIKKVEYISFFYEEELNKQEVVGKAIDFLWEEKYEKMHKEEKNNRL